MQNYNNRKVCLCQHPMYLLIDRDRGKPTVRERVSPWGAPDAESYVKRVKRNLKSLENFPDLKINYQFSGVEMEDMARDFPEVIKEIKKWAKKGRLSFIGGSYSQPHLHVFGSESNIKQFEYGLKVFKDIFNFKIRTYARQETGLHQQLPQILKGFGYEYVVPPYFPWVLRFIGKEPIPEITNRPPAPFIHGEEFTFWEALDATKIPLYLKCATVSLEQDLLADERKGLFCGPDIFIFFPDMSEVDGKWYKKITEKGKFYFLEKALKEQIYKYPPTSKSSVYSYWSYIEGVWAEALSRKNRQAELAIYNAEAMEVMAYLKSEKIKINQEKFENLWKIILTWQHHDVYWIEVTDLKKKAIQSLNGVIEKCLQIAEGNGKRVLYSATGSKKSSVIFNTLPWPRKVVIKEKKTVFVSDLPAFGYKVYSPKKERYLPIKRKFEFENPYYRAKIKKNGLFESLIFKESNEELLDTKKYSGGEIKGVVEGKLASTKESGKITSIKQTKNWRIVKTEGKLKNIPYQQTITFYQGLPTIDVSIDFNFQGNQIGTFCIDETKLNIYWPTTGNKIFYDIPFGVVEGREERPLFPTNWIDISGNKSGLAYINYGTPKHWVKNGVIANVIAWGDKFKVKSQEYDLKLYGKQKISYSLYPHQGNWQKANIPQIAANLIYSPVVIIDKQIGKKEESFL